MQQFITDNMQVTYNHFETNKWKVMACFLKSPVLQMNVLSVIVMPWNTVLDGNTKISMVYPNCFV